MKDGLSVNGLWKLPLLWKSAQDADSHKQLEKVCAQNAPTFSQLPQARRRLINMGNEERGNELSGEGHLEDLVPATLQGFDAGEL